MATPPRVHEADAAAAVAAIAARRAAIDDPSREQLTDDPHETLRYLRKHGGPDVPDAVRRADIEDGLRLWVWLWWEHATTVLWLLDRAETLDMNRRAVGRHLGIRTGQGVVDRRDRLRALLTHGRPDEKVSRAERAAAEHTATVEVRQRRWLDRHRTAIAAVAEQLVAHQDLADDEAADWIVEVDRDLRERACTPASFAVIELAVDALVTVDAVHALSEDHPLRRALRDWQALAAGYRRATRSSPQS